MVFEGPPHAIVMTSIALHACSSHSQYCPSFERHSLENRTALSVPNVARAKGLGWKGTVMASTILDVMTLACGRPSTTMVRLIIGWRGPPPQVRPNVDRM